MQGWLPNHMQGLRTNLMHACTSCTGTFLKWWSPIWKCRKLHICATSVPRPHARYSNQLQARISSWLPVVRPCGCQIILNDIGMASNIRPYICNVINIKHVINCSATAGEEVKPCTSYLPHMKHFSDLVKLHVANDIRPSTYLQIRIWHKLQCHDMFQNHPHAPRTFRAWHIS